MKVGFTGTRQGMTPDQKEAVRNLLIALNASELHHGDCIGSDGDCHVIARDLKIAITVHPPSIPSMRMFFKESCTVMAVRTYFERNRNIVHSTEVLIATPLEFAEINRSGTWSTVRYARKQGKTIYVVKPDGSFNGGKNERV